MFHGLRFTHYPSVHSSFMAPLSDGSSLTLSFGDGVIFLVHHDHRANRLALPLAHAILVMNQFLPVKVWTKSSFSQQDNLWSIAL